MYKLTIVEIKEETAHIFVVDFAPSIGLVLGYDFTAVFRYEFVLLGRILQKYAPTSDVRRCHQKMFIWTKLT